MVRPVGEDQQIFRETAQRSSRFHARKMARSRRALAQAGESRRRPIITDIDRKPFEAAMAGIYAKVQQDPAMAQLIERIRKVE